MTAHATFEIRALINLYIDEQGHGVWISSACGLHGIVVCRWLAVARRATSTSSAPWLCALDQYLLLYVRDSYQQVVAKCALHNTVSPCMHRRQVQVMQ